MGRIVRIGRKADEIEFEGRAYAKQYSNLLKKNYLWLLNPKLRVQLWLYEPKAYAIALYLQVTGNATNKLTS